MGTTFLCSVWGVSHLDLMVLTNSFVSLEALNDCTYVRVCVRVTVISVKMCTY